MPSLFRRKPATTANGKGGGRGATGPTYTVEYAADPAPVRRRGWGRQQAAPGLRFQYPVQFWLPLRLVGYGVIALGVLNVARAIPDLATVVNNPAGAPHAILALVAALLSLLFSVAAGALIADVLPSFEVRSEGLAVTEFVRWRVLPWERIVKLHSLTLPGERYVIFVEYDGGPISPEHNIYSLLAGLGSKSGVFFSSEIRRFDDLTRLILEMRMRVTPGARMEDLLDESVSMPVVEMVFNPFGTLATVAGLPEAEPSSPLGNVEERPPVNRRALAMTQLGLALVPVVIFVIDYLVNGSIPFLSPTAGGLLPGIIGLIGIGMLELPFVAIAIQALGENVQGTGELEPTLRTYPYLEMPRVLVFALIFALVVVRLPFFFVFLIWLVAIGWTAFLTLVYTQSLYRISQNQAALGAGASALVQFFVLVAYMMMRASGI